MEAEQFSLCWNNFNNNLRTGFHSLLKDEDLVDVTLAAEGHYLKAHKAVLSICSPYLKELFRANPGDHPIVILPDVSYSSLQSLLEFMYQGEVSVSQDEIPAFMKVAETLKVKGLTENENSRDSPTNTNGINDRNSPYLYGHLDTKLSTRSKPPAKKIIKPIETLRYTDSPKTGKSSPSVKSPSSSSSLNQQPIKKLKPAVDVLMNPKQEPMDENEDYDENLDMSAMLDTTLSEPGRSSESWMPDYKSSTDTSSPGGLFILKSRKGHPVLISDGHMYTLNRQDGQISTWYCVKRLKLICEGSLTTDGFLILSQTTHNHPQLHDVIKRLQAFSCTTDK